MRNNTKLKKILLANEVRLSLNADGNIELIVIANETGDAFIADGENLTRAIGEAYKHMRKLDRKAYKLS